MARRARLWSRISRGRCRSSAVPRLRTWSRGRVAPPSRAMRCSSLRRARATTCSRTMRSVAPRSGSSSRRCERSRLGEPPDHGRRGGARRVRPGRRLRGIEPRLHRGRRPGRLELRAAPGGGRGRRRPPGDDPGAGGLPEMAPVGVARARRHGVPARDSPAALHARDQPDDQRRAPLGEPGDPVAAAVGARQVHGRGVVRDARGQEGRAAPQPPLRRAAVSGGAGADDRSHLPRAQPVDGVARGDSRRDGAVHGGGPRRAFPSRGCPGHAAPLRRSRERAVSSRPGPHVLEPRCRADRSDVAGEAVAHRHRCGTARRRGCGAGPAEARLPAVRVFGFHLLDDRRGMGVPRRAGHHGAVRDVHISRFQNRAHRRRLVRPAARDGHHDDDRSQRRVAPRGDARRDSRDGCDAAVHLVRPLFADRRARGDGRPGECGARPETPPGGRVKILIAGGGTGGHLMPALALARAAAAAGHEPVLVGAARGIEAEILPSHPFRYYLLPLEPIYRRAWWRNLRWPLTLWRVWRAAARMLDVERPSLAIGTGGYAAGPALWFAGRRGIPIVLQEPDAYPGLTTRMLSRKARQVHLGFPEARARLNLGPKTEVFSFGNPIAPPPPKPADRAAALASFGLDAARPTVFVFGGSQGARALNDALAGALVAGQLASVNVLWGTGTAQYERYTALAQTGRVCVRGFFDPIAPAY